MRENYGNECDAQEMARRQQDALGGAANAIRTSPDIGRVTGPLVRLLTMDGLSWSEREQITDAIQNLIRIRKDMESERRHLSGACGQMSAAGGAFVVDQSWGPARANAGN